VQVGGLMKVYPRNAKQIVSNKFGVNKHNTYERIRRRKKMCDSSLCMGSLCSTNNTWVWVIFCGKINFYLAYIYTRLVPKKQQFGVFSKLNHESVPACW